VVCPVVHVGVWWCQMEMTMLKRGACWCMVVSDGDDDAETLPGSTSSSESEQTGSGAWWCTVVYGGVSRGACWCMVVSDGDDDAETLPGSTSSSESEQTPAMISMYNTESLPDEVKWQITPPSPCNHHTSPYITIHHHTNIIHTFVPDRKFERRIEPQSRHEA